MKAHFSFAVLVLAGALAVPLGLTTARADGPERSEDRATLRPDPALLARVRELEARRRNRRRAVVVDARNWSEHRAERASEHRREVAALWGDVVGGIDARAELRMHADRMARLNRMLDVAEQTPGEALAPRVQSALQRELSRHVLAMQRVRALSGMQ